MLLGQTLTEMSRNRYRNVGLVRNRLDIIGPMHPHPLQIIGMPFKRIAFDLVGQYPRTSRGHKYILPSICYFSRYPEIIPLKRVDENSIASAMVEIISRSGFPSEILTD